MWIYTIPKLLDKTIVKKKVKMKWKLSFNTLIVDETHFSAWVCWEQCQVFRFRVWRLRQTALTHHEVFLSHTTSSHQFVTTPRFSTVFISSVCMCVCVACMFCVCVYVCVCVCERERGRGRETQLQLFTVDICWVADQTHPFSRITLINVTDYLL